MFPATPEEARARHAANNDAIAADYAGRPLAEKIVSKVFGVHDRFQKLNDAALRNAMTTGDFSVPNAEQVKQTTIQATKQATIQAAILATVVAFTKEFTETAPPEAPQTPSSPSESQQKTSESTQKSVTRYMGQGEVDEATRTGNIPNYDKDGNPRPTHVTTDAPVDSASEAQKRYELPVKPTHRATVPAHRVPDLGPTPDGRSTTSGGGSQNATSKPVPVSKDEIKELDD